MLHSSVHYQQWYQVFEWFEWLIDLPHLNSINLGYAALNGRNNDDCSLIMESDIDMNELIIDLPNLTSITSEGDTFDHLRSISLSSLILNEWWIDIPNLQTVDLPGSFQFVQFKSITSIYMNIIEWIDVSPILANLLPFTPNDIEKLDSNTTSINIPDYSINNENYNTFNFSRFTLLEELIIGDDCFENVNLFKIDGLNELKSLKIGNISFSNSNGNDESRSFSVLNCIELESIEIGSFSFRDYGGGFELKNLPKLSTIKIGEIGFNSFNFCFSSFVIKGIIDDITNE